MGLLLHEANKGLDSIKKLFESGELIPSIEKCYPLTETGEALSYFAAGHVRGKVVIKIAS